MQSLRPRQNAYFTLLWTSNGVHEIQPLNLSPTRNFKRTVFILKICVISSHMALHFINVLTLSEISKTVRLIGRKYSLINWKTKEIHHEVSRWLDRFSILVRSIKKNIRSIKRNSRLIENLKKFITKSLPESIDSRFLFDQSKEILDQSRLVKLKFFQVFLVTFFDISLEQNTVPWS